MTNQPPDPATIDPFDADLRELFAGMQPSAGFEDRIIHAVRQRNRFAIPMAVKRAAIAAAAVLVVGAAGYYGNQAITGNLRSRSVVGSAATHPARRPDVYRKGDLINITINDEMGLGQEQTYQCRVNQAGNIHLKMLGDIKAEGLTDDQLQNSIADNFKNGQIVPKPLVTIYTLEGTNHQESSEPNFGGGSNSPQNWKGWNDAGGITKNSGYNYQNPFTGDDGITNSSTARNSDARFAFNDVNHAKPALTGPTAASNPAHVATKSSQHDNLDSVLLPYARSNGYADSKAITSSASDRLNSVASPPPATLAPPAAGESLPLGRDAVVGNVSGLGYFHGNTNGQIASTADLDQTRQKLGFKVGEFDAAKSPVIGTNSNLSNSGGSGDQTLDVASKGQSDKVAFYSTDKQSTLAGLVQDARQFTDEGKYVEALKVTENIQRLDPNNAYANGVKDLLSDKARNQDTRNYKELFKDNFNVNLDAAGPGKKVAVPGLVNINSAPAEALAQAFAAPAAGTSAPDQLKPPAAKTPASLAAPAPAPAVDDRKIIRTGSMEFDVDRFDTAQMQITKIVGELGGFVGATDSTKLPNGKVRGSISVRVPPERLDTLVLSLRALGDLKSQQITAADITKEYTDIQSELAADRAMQDRLLQLIHDGKGTVKDLLAAENELGEWRTKIEKAEGMIRYYNGQVALSTLSITMTERDIHTPAAAVETETADVGIEADDVEKARANAMKAIDDAKGRIIEAELKRFDAGQLAAKLVADVPPESAGAVIDQLKLLGKVARLEVHRQQQNTDGTAAVTNNTPLRTERKPTRLLISIYNLANVAPRRTTVVNLAAKDVEGAYAALVSTVKSTGGRVVTSNLDRGDPVKATGSLVLELPPEKFDSALATLHAQGDVLNLNLTENPDTQNSTEAKQGLTIKLISLANVAPRRTTNTSLAANDVDAAYNTLIALAKNNGGRVVSSTLDRADAGKTSGSLILEFPPDQFESALNMLHAQGDVLNLNQSENPDVQNSTEAKQGLTVKLFSQAAVKARENIDQTIAAVDVPASYQAILSAASSAHARIEQAALNEQDRQNISADIELEVPRASAGELDKAIAGAGGTLARTSSRAPDTETAVDSKLHLKLTISSADRLPPRETTRLQVEVNDVDKSAGSVQAAALAAGGRVLEASVRRDNGQSIGRVILDLPLIKSMELLQQVRSQGTVRNIDSSRDPQAPAGPMAHAQIFVEFRTGDAIVADQTGPWASIREGLSTSINGLLWSLRWVVVGLCLLGPWALIAWGGWKLRGRFMRAKSVEAKV